MSRFLWEIDWRIELLHDVIVGINVGLAAIQERLDTEEWFDGLSARERAEPLFGLGFVAAQTYAIGTVSDLNSVRISRHKSKKNKLYFYDYDNVALKRGITRIQLINASANYFKHHDQWTGWPTRGRGAYDTKTLGRVGINEKTEFPCIGAVELLCGTGWDLIALPKILKEWRAHLFDTLT